MLQELLVLVLPELLLQLELLQLRLLRQLQLHLLRHLLTPFPAKFRRLAAKWTTRCDNFWIAREGIFLSSVLYESL